MTRRAGLEQHLICEPDFVLPTSIRTKYGAVKEVPCRVYLPDSVMGRPYLAFEPSFDQRVTFTVPEFSFEGNLDLPLQKVHVRAETVFTEGWTSSGHAPGVVQVTLPGEPWDLRITITNCDEQENGLIRHGILWLTPSPLFSRGLVIDLGATKVRFGYERLGSDPLRPGALVAEFKDLEPALLDSAIEQLDDLLLVASLATRHPCVCRGWRTLTDNSDTRIYRSRVAAPELKKISQQETLIDTPEFESFINYAYRNFRQHPAREPIAQSINHLLRADQGTLESSFFSLFSGLETIIASHRSSSGLDRILDEASWTAFEKELKIFIKTQSILKGDSARRNLIYQKIPELNRMSFGAAFHKCVDSLRLQGLNLDDLWPVTGGAEGLSLSDVRNKLIHGDVLTPPQEEALMVAKIHLAWCIERILLALLDWPVERSLVGKFLRHTIAYNGWQKARDTMSKVSP